MTGLQAFGLEGKVALITGASSGLGVAFATALADAGADIGLGGRRVERLASTKASVEALGRRAVAYGMDVTKPQECTDFVEAVFAELGRIDILVNNAGVGTSVPATREPPETFIGVVDTNLMGSYWMAQACARRMREGSSIVNIGSIIGSTTAWLPQAAYASSKAAIIGLTRDLAQQWSGRKGIRVNALAPGFFPTEMTDELQDGYLDRMVAERIPMSRLGRLEECASAVQFLASDAASYITGVVLPVDGGLLTT